jgi:flagellin
MTRINTNVDSLIALNNLARTNNRLGVSLTRLSTGVRVNSGKDDPAGLISGEFLRQEISSIRSAVANNNRANSMLSTADAALGEISNLLDDIRGILTTSANKGVLSQEEKEANQTAIDSAVESINRIATNTQFAGRKLLDGSLGFQLTGLNGLNLGDGLAAVQINRATFNADGDPITITIDNSTDAAQATVDLTPAPASDTVIQVVGNRGAATINIAAAATAQNIVDAVNATSDVTGVSAAVSGGNARLSSEEYGSDQFVTVNLISGPDAITGGVAQLTDTGVDVAGTMNGVAFEGVGRKALLRTATLDLEVTFSAGLTGDPTDASFTITGGGVQFQLGQEINSQSQINIAIQSVHAGSLGNAEKGFLSSVATGGTNSLLNDKEQAASAIIKLALSQVAGLRARLGALQKNTIETNVNSLSVSLENITAARSQIVDTDFAGETAELTRLQILVQAGTSSLAIANARPQSVLSLLG